MSTPFADFSRPHYLALAVAAAAFALVYWGLERRPPHMREGARAPALLASTSAQALMREASGTLDARTEAEVHGFEQMLEGAGSDERRVEVLKQLSGAWYRAEHPALAGHYAERVAELAPSDTAWGIAATTYSLCLRADGQTDKARAFCRERAVVAYESAISLAPEVTAHKLNLATHLADNPPADNPMRGILMLRDLNRANPDDVAVLIQLGRLSLQTDQVDRALERLTRATGLEPDNRSAQCLLAEAAARHGDVTLAATARQACQRLAN